MLCSQYIPRLKRTCHHRVEKGFRKCYQHRKIKFPRPPECPICLVPFARYFVPLNPCKHWVCPDCIVRSGKKECPFCRSSIKVPAKNMTMLRFYARQNVNHIENANIDLLPTDLQINLRLVMALLSENDQISVSDSEKLSQSSEY